MNLYEFLTQELNNRLGNNYNLVYNNNDSVKWDEILTTDMINGVFRISGGSASKAAGVFVEAKELVIDFAIPSELSILNPHVVNIDETFNALNEVVLTNGNQTVQIEYNYRSDATYLGAINGTKYVLISVYATVLVTDTVVFSNELEIYIDNTLVEGVISATPSTRHQYDNAVVDNKVKLYHNSLQYSLTLNLIVKREYNLIAKLMYEKNQKKKYSVKIVYSDMVYVDSRNVQHDITDEYQMSITECTINAITGDSLKVTIGLLEV